MFSPLLKLFLLGSISISQTIAKPAIIPRSPTNKYQISPYIIPLNPPKKVWIDNFSASIRIGNHTLNAVLDTGSSNIWFMTPSTQCADPQTGDPIPSSECGYRGPKYTPDPSSFMAIPDVHANISYVIGDVMNGIHGVGNVTFGGLQVDYQQLSLATYAKSSYDGPWSGLIGLAYQSITTIYPGVDPSKDIPCIDSLKATSKNCNLLHYRPLLSTIFQRNLTKPIFAFAMSRSKETGGIMTLGGIPDPNDAQINATNGPEATVPIEREEGSTEYSEYYIPVDGLNFTGAAAGAGKGQYLVDTGTVPNIVPQEQAEAINALFDPPAVYNKTKGGSIAQCNATAPDISVEIGGQLFGINRKN
ncbi:acid protease [Mytilinidion resinicola]|uniref:Acid protease n=1 Tax=Mytilinidion resinicola TaxID=574789 RepID=A0A6A6YRI7_9PEZI|nr:acid protease [Mytilinidion resinicola]KAF2810654.1 acid protease [Mytilinidion resinicola]